MKSNERIRELYIRNKWIILLFVVPFFWMTAFYNINTLGLIILAVVFLLYCFIGYKIMSKNGKGYFRFKVVMPYLDVIFCAAAIFLRGGFRSDTFMLLILLFAIYPIFENKRICYNLCVFSMLLYSLSCLYYRDLSSFYWEGFLIRLTFLPITLFVALYFSKTINHLKNNLAEEMLNARKDHLTGLWNRKMLNEILKKLSRESKLNHEKKYGILIIDLDNFKAINDNYGHDKGDFVLMNVAHCICQNISRKDTPFRLGGDEFLVLIKDCDEHKLRQCSEKIRSSIGRLRFNFDNALVGITVSIGGSLSSEGDFNEMFKVSDERLYYGKTNGKDIGITC